MARFDIPFAPGGKLAIRGVSPKGLGILCAVLVCLGLLAYFFFMAWYRQHPVLGTVVIGLAVIWVVRQIVRFFCALNNDPYTRPAPPRWKD